jgi:hypothetical protein
MVCLSAGNRKKRRRKEVKKTWLCAANFSSAWHTRLSGGAPDSVRCARLVRGELAALGTRRRRTAIIHRTVRWCTRLSGEPTVIRVNGRSRDQRATRGQANGHLIAPDCPVCTGQCLVRQGDRRANGRLRQKRKEIGHRTGTVHVRWRTRLSGAPPDRRQGLLSKWNPNGS